MRWPREDWALHLVLLLEGKTRAAYVAMDSEEICDYAKVKDTILKKYEINKETYRQRFRSNEVLLGEMPHKLFTRLQGLYERWMMPREKTKEERFFMSVLFT